MTKTLKALSLILLLTIIAFFVVMFAWEPSLTVEAQSLWGFRLTAVGFFVTFVGFAITIVQTIRAVTAAEAAQASVKKLKENLGSFDAVGTIGSAKATVEEGLGHLAASRWEALMGGFNRLDSHLSELIAAPKYLDIECIEKAKELKARTLDACMELGNSLKQGPENLDEGTLGRNLRDVKDFMIRLAANMKDRVNG